MNSAVTDTFYDNQQTFRALYGRLRNQWINPVDWITLAVGQDHLMPLRWNNPHASEVEVNIWVTDYKVVVPIRKPACSGEGYKANIFTFRIPTDFLTLATKVPNFNGCNAVGDCVLQIYAHSVESRVYAVGIPLIVPGSGATVSNPAQDSSQIQPMTVDPGTNLGALTRDVCLSSNDSAVHITSAIPRFARLVSDVYNHAYQNSDFSPYSGQQHEAISRNMQAACIVSMVPANRGELGKSILQTNETNLLTLTRQKAVQLVKQYESIVNSFISDFGLEMRTERTPFMPYGSTCIPQHENKLVNRCFRCVEVDSLVPTRLTTNTYIPSFQLPTNLIQRARGLAPADYANIVSSSGVVQIYVATLETMNATFQQLESYGFGYMGPKVKSTTTTMADATNFKKIRADGSSDNGQYAAQQAKAAAQTSQSTANGGFGQSVAAPAALEALVMQGNAITFPATGFAAVGLMSEAQMNGMEPDLPCEGDFDNSTGCMMLGLAMEGSSTTGGAQAGTTGGAQATTTGGAQATTGGAQATTGGPQYEVAGSGRNHFARQALAAAFLGFAWCL